jgi:hypothetical protein
VARPRCAAPTLRDGGLLIAVTSDGDLASEAAGDRVRVPYMLVKPDRAGLEAIAELADRGRLRVPVAQTLRWRRPHGRTNAARPDRPQAKLVLTIN